jgi:hypothetical protein
MWHALERQFEGIKKKFEVLVWLAVFEKKQKVAI